MPIATPEVYAEMLARAKEHSFAFPAINCTSSETINAAIKGFADAGSDGIIQFSTGGAEFGSGLGVKDMVTGAVALAEFAHVIAAKYDITVALHTDHCPKDKLDTYVRPLLAISAERVAKGQNPLFQSHMWDGSAVPLAENLTIAQELLAQAAAAHVILAIAVMLSVLGLASSVSVKGNGLHATLSKVTVQLRVMPPSGAPGPWLSRRSRRNLAQS